MAELLQFTGNKPENKKTEKGLEETCELYRELFENANDCIYAINLEGEFLAINNSVVKALKCDSAQEVLESNMSKWMTPESLEKAKEFIQEVIAEKDYFDKSVELENIRKDGEHVWFEHKARPIKDKNDKIIGLHGIGRDITKKIGLEKELKESEERYRELFENANDPMYTHDLMGNILTINKVGMQLLGGNEDLIGSNISTWLTPESYKLFEDRVRRIYLNQPVEPTVDIEVINKNGEHKWGEARTRLIKDGDRILAVHGIVRDITEKRKLKQELRESEEKYRDLFENAQDGMYVLDNERNFLRINLFGLQTLGCTEEEVIGTNISKWITLASMKIVDERRIKRLSGELLDQADVLEIVCKNGEHRWIEIKTREIKDGDRTIEIHGIARDITQNRLLKQELKKSNKQQKLLCYLIQGTRGGKTRALILKHLAEGSFNANQLATALNMDYKTIRHHLNVLIKNGIIGKGNNGPSDLYFISNNIEVILNDFNPVSIRNR